MTGRHAIIICLASLVSILSGVNVCADNWYEHFDASVVGEYDDMDYIQGDLTEWSVGAVSTITPRRLVEITADKSLHVRAWNSGWAGVESIGFSSPVYLTSNLQFGFTVVCSTSYDPVANEGGISVSVTAFNPSTQAAAVVRYTIDSEPGHPFPTETYPHIYIPLGASGTYTRNLWQDFSSIPGVDLTGFMLGDVQMFAKTQGPETVDAVFDDLWVGQPPAHTLSVTASANPGTITNGGSTQLNATASDSSGHGIASWHWSDNGAGGTFTPNADVKNPTWRSPGNTTGSTVQRRFAVSATCNGSSPLTASATVTINETTVIAAAPPVNVSLSPASGSLAVGPKLTFTSRNSDVNGVSNLANCYLLLNTTLNQASAAFLRYDANANLLYVKNDANTDWGTGRAPGSAYLLENSYCKLYCAETTLSTVGNVLAINWKVQLKNSMSGKTCGAWMLVYDDGGLKDGWDKMATYKFGGAPANVSISPTTGVVATATKLGFACNYSDPDGYGNLANCYLLINNALNQVNAVFLRYDANANKLYVKNDANTDWGTGCAPGSANVLQNSYCKLYCADTTVTGSVTTLTINWKVEFKPTMSGKTCGAWLLVYDDISLRDGWDQVGSNIRIGQPPSNVSLAPVNLPMPAGSKTTFIAKYSDPDGCANIANCYLLLNTSLNQVNAVFVRYDANANLLYVKDDANASWGTGYAPGSAVILENSRCLLHCAETTVNTSGTTLTVNWSVTLKSALQGVTLRDYMLVYDDICLRDGYDDMGYLVLF